MGSVRPASAEVPTITQRGVQLGTLFAGRKYFECHGQCRQLAVCPRGCVA